MNTVSVFHGTNEAFTEFRPGTAGACWFTTDEEHASYFGEPRRCVIEFTNALEIDFSDLSALSGDVATAVTAWAHSEMDDDEEVRIAGEYVSVGDAVLSPETISEIISLFRAAGGYELDQFVVTLAEIAKRDCVALRGHEGNGTVYALRFPNQARIAE